MALLRDARSQISEERAVAAFGDWISFTDERFKGDCEVCAAGSLLLAAYSDRENLRLRVESAQSIYPMFAAHGIPKEEVLLMDAIFERDVTCRRDEVHTVWESPSTRKRARAAAMGTLEVRRLKKEDPYMPEHEIARRLLLFVLDHMLANGGDVSPPELSVDEVADILFREEAVE
jgi:hypothetical protein